ncbi:hypothetical protein A5819_002578 [Enterococcus sp. 7E2_DIV0204]|nr:hypothetical protein A5819_002578 [Enterococcus sp. 7E2_DIV0204]OTP52534.1 hypothetical protein A5884_001736 [Enterococcus sp. 7D2_DIV0200]
MVPEDELTKVNGQFSMVQSANFIIAPALGAVLYSIVPMNFLILLDVLGAVFGVGLLIFFTIPKVTLKGEAIHLLADTKFGFKKLFENKGLWYIMIVGSIFMLLFMPAASLYPLMTMNYFNESVGQAGLVEVVYFVGMLIGGAEIGILGKWKNRMTLIFWAYAVIGASIGLSGLLPATSKGFIYFVLLNSIAGFATPYFITLLMAMSQQSYDPNVLGVLNSLMSITGPVGLIFVGLLADRIGVEKMFVIAGIGTLVCGVINFMIPVSRNYDKELQKRLAKAKVEEDKEVRHVEG